MFLRAAALSLIALAIVGCGDDEPSSGEKGADPSSSDTAPQANDVYPSGGTVPEPRTTDLKAAAKAAGCELQTVSVGGRDHVPGPVSYPTKPPAGGDHFEVAAEDGIYPEAPPAESLVHALEHGRVVIWFKAEVEPDVRANLKAMLDEDGGQQLLTPDPTGMAFEVSATAWNREPEPIGTGRLLGCPKAGNRVYDALAAFRDEHRGRGPEPVP